MYGYVSERLCSSSNNASQTTFDLLLNACGSDFEQTAIRRATAVFANRLGNDTACGVWCLVDDLAAGVLMLTFTGERNRQNLTVSTLAG